MRGRCRGDALWIYERLLATFGPRGWWPVTPRGKTKPVYSPRYTRGILDGSQQFEMAVGAILTQNTAWLNVEKAMEQLSRARCLSPARLSRISFRSLCSLIRSSGYFRQKSRRLKDFARYLVLKWSGCLGGLLCQNTTDARIELLSLSGIGPETADSILLYAGKHAIFVVDAYTRRIGRRFGLFSTDDYHEVQKTLMKSVPNSVPLFREYHALLVELAKRHCRKQPLCDSCPIGTRCAARKGSHA